MRRAWIVFKGEVVKQHHHNFHSSFVYFSLLVWPVLGFFTVYYSYLPFSLQAAAAFGIHSSRDMLVFLSTGYMGHICFYSCVQSAWSASWSERQSGTLEIAFLSPANRLAMMYGKALGALLEQTWMFVAFCVILLVYVHGFSLRLLAGLPVTFLLLLASSTVWGGLMNSVCLFSRDASVLMSVFDAPLKLFSGVRTPIQGFPLWGRVIACLFPLTFCLNIMRIQFLGPALGQPLVWNLLFLLLCLVVMVLLTILFLKKAERIHRERGELSLF